MKATLFFFSFIHYALHVYYKEPWLHRLDHNMYKFEAQYTVLCLSKIKLYNAADTETSSVPAKTIFWSSES